MSGASLRNNAEQNRYELLDGGEVVGIADYQIDGDKVIFTHTKVGDAYEGKGYGSKLAKLALDDVLAQGKKIVPRCAFIAVYVKRHPEYASEGGGA